MISQNLMDKLLYLRLPAFRDGLREQQTNPQYAQLSFEERLLLLADLECARRSDNRTKRRLKLAEFPLRASIEDLDFSPTRGLVLLSMARKDGSYLSLLRSLSKNNILILDDWMRDPIQLSAAQDLLELFDDRFGHSATIIVSQVPISEWHARFPDPTLADAILDRIIHNAYRISLSGESQRKLRGFRSMPHT